MISTRRIQAFAVAASVTLAGISTAVAQAPGIGSDASDISASFTAQGFTVTLGPVNDVHGACPPAYSRGSTLASYHHRITLPPPVPQVHPIVADLIVTSQNLRSGVMSKCQQLDFISASGNASIGATHLQIITDGPSGSNAPYLDVSLQSASAAASYTFVDPKTPSVSGSASLDSLTIFGSLLGGRVVTFSGSPAANTVLYQDSVVTIFANQQVTPGLITCDPTCHLVPSSISVNALAVELNGAVIQNFPTTGGIELGSASAF